MTVPSLEAWAAQTKNASPLLSMNGNSAWAQRYSQELREVVVRYADRLPRNVQRHLGPSELGHHCDRQLVGKMAGVSLSREHGNNLHDPWASIVGTAIHAFLEEAFKWESTRLIREVDASTLRWYTEKRVTPDPGNAVPHPGTADLYDAVTKTLNDHKCQSEGVRDKLRRHGPPHHYFMQMLLYAVGYMHEGYDVQRICLVSWPRTHSTLDDMYVWEHVITADDIALVVDLIEKTEVREQLAVLMAQGELGLFDIPATPSDSDCQFCPFFRPDAASNPNVKGCPGTAGTNRARSWLPVSMYMLTTHALDNMLIVKGPQDGRKWDVVAMTQSVSGNSTFASAAVTILWKTDDA